MNIGWQNVIRAGISPYIPVASALLGIIGVVGAIAIGILTGSILGAAVFGVIFLITGVLLLKLRCKTGQVEAVPFEPRVIVKAEAKKRVDEERDLSPAARELLLNYVRHRRSWPSAEFQRHLELAKAHSLNREAALACDNPISWILTYQEHMNALVKEASEALKNEALILSSFSYQNLEAEGIEAKDLFKELTNS